MDLENNDSESRRRESFSWTSSVGSSLRRDSFSFSNIVPAPKDDDLESESVSKAGDIGDRALHGNMYSESGRLRLSVDNVMESGSVVPIPEDALLESYGFWSGYPTVLTTPSPVTPSTLEIISPHSTEAIIHSADKKQVLTRYLLQKLFSPGVVGATSDQSYMYLDLPSNMVVDDTWL